MATLRTIWEWLILTIFCSKCSLNRISLLSRWSVESGTGLASSMEKELQLHFRELRGWRGLRAVVLQGNWREYFYKSNLYGEDAPPNTRVEHRTGELPSTAWKGHTTSLLWKASGYSPSCFTGYLSRWMSFPSFSEQLREFTGHGNPMPWSRNTQGPFSQMFLQRRFLYSEVRKGAPGPPGITTVTAGNNTTSGQCQRFLQDRRGHFS